MLFNYQSVAGDPAVLTILATREGTSITVIDNQRDQFDAGRTWGQRLFFNQNGERASFTGQRRSEFAGAQGGDGSGGAGIRQQAGLNMVLLVQVPLKQKAEYLDYLAEDTDVVFCCAPMAGEAPDVEDAVIGHGPPEGPFTEIDGLEIERDDRYPIRVTVQFYKATSNGVVTAEDMAEIAGQIQRVYREAD